MNKFITIVLIIILGIILFAGGLGVIFITKSDSTKSDSTESNPVQKNCINDCSGYGDCDTTSGDCTCYQGFSGIDCSIQCPNLCSKHGTCDNGTCICKSGFFGEECQFIKCHNDCSGNGTCDNQTGVCDCKNGSTQTDCSNKCPGYPNNTCSNNGICDQNSGVCSCKAGYYGNDCSGKCPNLCSNNGTCDQKLGVCSCKADYYGNDCSLSCPKDSNNNICSNNGVCEFDGKNIKCVCYTGYTGSDCSERTCPGDCSGNGGTCNVSTGVCSCNTGYYGNDCSVACPGADDNNICSGTSKGTCVYNGTSTVCNCNDRYYGSNCESKCSDDNIFDYTNKICSNQKYLTDINGYKDFRVYNSTDVFNKMLVNNQSNPITDFNKRFYIKKITINNEKRYVITNNNNIMFKLVPSTVSGTDTYYFKVTTNSNEQATFKIFKLYNTFNLVSGGATSDQDGNAYANIGSFVAKGKGNNVIRWVHDTGQSNPNYQSLWDNIDERLNIKLDCIENCDINCYCPTPPTPPSNQGSPMCKVVLPSNTTTSSIQRCVNNTYVYGMMLSFGGSVYYTGSSEVIYYLKDGSIVICIKYNNKYYFRKTRGTNNKLYSFNNIPTFTNFSNFDKFISSVNLTIENNATHSIRQIYNFSINNKNADDVYFLGDGDIIVCKLDSTVSTGAQYTMSRFGDNKSFYCVSNNTVLFTNFNNYTDFVSSATISGQFNENITNKYNVKIKHGWFF